MSNNLEWQETKFSEAISINPRESLKKGTSAKKVGMADVQEHTKQIANYEFEKYKSGPKFRQNDTLFARITPCLENGKISKVNILNKNEVGFGSTEFIVMRAKPNITDSDFVYYLSRWDGVRETAIKSMTGTSGRQRVQNAIFDKLIINLPPIIEQKEIASIFSSLDEKIENNNAIIANLEEQAQALFKLKFINIEPSEESKFEKVKLGKLFTFVKGKKPKKIIESVKEGFIPYLVKKYIDSNELTYAKANDGILIDDLDVFMLMDGANSGNIYYGYHGILGSTFSWLKNDNEMINEYLYWYLKINQEEVKKQNTGSAIPHANKDYINNMEVLVPIDINENLTLSTLRSIRLYTINLRRESNKHAEIRDTLLPKLMSGEIRVGDVVIEE